jgi:hypothetical protein
MLGIYFVAVVWSLYDLLGISIVGWQGLAFPDPMTSFFYFDGILLACIVYSLLCSLAVSKVGISPMPSAAAPEPGARPGGALWRWAAVALLLATSAWAAVVYLGKRTHGATASDPYAYSQMAVDLATRGTLLHRFTLFQDIAPLGIAWGPVVPVGYHLPQTAWGDSPSVWATGASVLLAGAYRVLGEVGLYVTTPILALLALLATWALVQEVLRAESRLVRCVTGALTVALTATSPEHVDRLLVPMADAAAQLFTLSTLLFCLRAMRWLGESPRRAVAPLVLAGTSFAWAYWVRHTQLVLFLPVCLGILLASLRARGKGGSMAAALQGGTVNPRDGRTGRGALSVLWPPLVFSVAALLMAVPDTLYRLRVFGSIFATETTELPFMGLQYVGTMAWQTLRDFLVAGEWGYLFPFALVGSILLVRRHRRESVVLGGAVALVLVVHLSYRFLRLRDLISLFPLVNLAASYGSVRLVQSFRSVAHHSRQQRRLGSSLLASASVAWVVLSIALARWTMIDDLCWPGWASFGYMDAIQRQAFERLAELTPPQAVIGASLNAGAVMLYSGRDAFRPADTWTDDEWSIFVGAMRSNSRPIFLLDDSSAMASFIHAQESSFRLVPIEPVFVPVFDVRVQERDAGWLYRLEETK